MEIQKSSKRMISSTPNLEISGSIRKERKLRIKLARITPILVNWNLNFYHLLSISKENGGSIDSTNKFSRILAAHRTCKSFLAFSKNPIASN
jgi:hypothetical protein